MTHAEREAIKDSIGRLKNDIGKRKREDRSTAMLKNDGDGNFGKKVREKKATSTAEKKLKNLLSRLQHTLLKKGY